MRYLSQTGFSLIEPAIVSAVFCVFLVLALPAYLDLSEGTGISIGLQLSAPVREAVAEYAASHGGFPGSNLEAGLGEGVEFSDRHVRSIHIGSDPAPGTVVITYRAFGGVADGDSLLLTPVRYGTSLVWNCSSSTLLARLLPSSCR